MSSSGSLVDELDRRGILEQTWLIITSDHGESFGEHAGVFCHGKSLYETELHVPLLIIPPGGGATKQAVNETVSLRDAGGDDHRRWLASRPARHFPVNRWRGSGSKHRRPAGAAIIRIPHCSPRWFPPNPHERDYWGLPKQLSPLGAIKEEEWSYIRREGDVREELFHLSEDAKEQRNLAGDPAAQTILEQMRAALDRLTEGPLLPERFSP